jgi:hypothetical protein
MKSLSELVAAEVVRPRSLRAGTLRCSGGHADGRGERSRRGWDGDEDGRRMGRGPRPCYGGGVASVMRAAARIHGGTHPALLKWRYPSTVAEGYLRFNLVPSGRQK